VAQGTVEALRRETGVSNVEEVFLAVLARAEANLGAGAR
jgi:hypothetical protein